MDSKTFVKGIWKSIVISLLIIIPGILNFSQLGWTDSSSIGEQQSIYISSRSAEPTTMSNMYKVGQKISKNISAISPDIILNCSNHDIELEVLYPNDADVDKMIGEMRESLSGIRLPHFVKFPVISRSSRNTKPFMKIFIQSNNEKLKTQDITNKVKKFLSKKIESIGGVVKIEIYGNPKEEIMIDMDPGKVIAYGIDFEKLKRALDTYILEESFLEQKTNTKSFQSYSESFLTQKAKETDIVKYIEEIVIDNRFFRKENSQRIIKLKDIGKVSFNTGEFRTESWVNGKRGVVIQIYKSVIANPVDVSKGVMKELKEWLEDKNLSIYIEDSAEQIRTVVNKTFKSFIEAIILVLITILIFLGSWKASITPILSIPISIIGSFWPMKAFGCTINISTLSAFILAIGLVVDDAIVMIEGITHEYVHSKDKNWENASIKATKNLTVPIIVMTSTLMFIFLPIIFTKGVLGQVLKEFAITLSSAVLISGVVSLTLSPAISARFMEHKEWADKLFAPLERGYKKILNYLDRFKKPILILTGFFVAFSLTIFNQLPRETFPSGEKNNFAISSINDKNPSMQYLNIQGAKISNILKKIPEIKVFKIFMDSGISVNIDFKDSTKNINEVKEKLFEKIAKEIPEIHFVVNNKESNDSSFIICIYGNKDLDVIEDIGFSFVRSASRIRGIKDFIKISSRGEVWDIIFDTKKAMDLGIDIHEVKNIVKFINSRYKIGKTLIGENKINIISSSNPSVALIKKVNFPTLSSEKAYNPSLFIQYKRLEKETSKHGFRAMNAVKYKILFDPKEPLGPMLEEFEQLKKKLLGKEFDIFYTGSARQFLTEKDEMRNTLILSVVFITLILLAQFESLRKTIIVISTAPLSFCGAVFMLFLSSSSVNVYTITGLITLIALIIKHGILFVSGTTELVEQGMKESEAIFEAAAKRLRAVLMTTICMFIGVIPLIFSKEIEMISIQQISLIISGGILIGTIMTLFVVPLLMKILVKEDK